VVSEERGEVTVFKDQTILNIKDQTELNQVLREYAGTVPATSGVRNQRLRLYLAALVCLAGVTGFWFSFARGFETFATLEVPVEFINRNPKMEIFSASASSVKLQISGSGSLIRSVRSDQIKVKLNLAHAVAGNSQVAITRDGIVLPPGIELKQIEPQTLEVNLDIPIQKKLPIQPDWTGKLPAGFIMQGYHTIPDTVEVIGGTLTLKDIRTIFTEKVPLENITTDGKKSVGLVLLPSSLRFANVSQKNAVVVYKIAGKQPQTDVEVK
jgi:YbbR domain-containing protein